MAKKMLTADEIMGELAKLDALRKPILVKREANRKKKAPSKEVEAECNKNLAALNIQIKEMKDAYPQAKAIQDAEEAGEVRAVDLKAIREQIDQLAEENKKLREELASIKKANSALK